MITVLRLGHRPFRDVRATTHCALVARAFGADEIVYTGDEDSSFEKSVSQVCEQWGGNFKVSYSKSYKQMLNKKDAVKVHLTMYGEPIAKRIGEIRKHANVIVVVGGEKVPGEVYQACDYNLGVGNQPHSEVAALAVFLHEYFEGRELEREFGGKIRVIPSARGKKVEKSG